MTARESLITELEGKSALFVQDDGKGKQSIFFDQAQCALLLEALRAVPDAERYRWLRHKDSHIERCLGSEATIALIHGIRAEFMAEEELDIAVDNAAIATAKPDPNEENSHG